MGLLTLEEAAERLQVSKSTVRRMISMSQIPVIRLSVKCLRIDAVALDKFLIKAGKAQR